MSLILFFFNYFNIMKLEKVYYSYELLNFLGIDNKKYNIKEIKKFLLKKYKTKNNYISNVNRKEFKFLNLKEYADIINENKIKVSILLLIIHEKCSLKKIIPKYLYYNYNDKPIPNELLYKSKLVDCIYI